MDKIQCSQCKHRDLDPKAFPCCACKFACAPSSPLYHIWLDFFEPDAKSTEASPDQVNHTAHYAGKIEFINAMLETMGRADVRTFCLCTAFEYLWPCKKKHSIPTEDVEKALWYLEKYIELGGNL